MSDDNNALKDVDLSAWDVPAPERLAEDLADDVIAVARGTDIGAAIPVEGPASTRKRALVIAGVAAAVIAVTVGAWVVVRGAKQAAPRDGMVIAEKAQALELDAAHADLDPGADVRWTRKGSVLRVEQRVGSAAWHVGTDSKLVIEAGIPGAALASVDATGASLRVEVKPMNAADMKIAGTVVTTAAAVALVTVVVYEGHVKVRDNGTQQTVIVQPGTTYTVTPRPEPMPIVDDESTLDDDSVVGVAPVGLDETPDVSIVAGDDVFIHDMSPPTRVKIDMTKACRNGKVDLVINGVTTSGSDTLAFNRGKVKYAVLCDDIEVTSGAVAVTRDSLVRPLSVQPAVNSIYADGRTYSVSFQQMPAIEVHGGPGTLHVASGAIEKTYEARGESVLIPSADLMQGSYKLWFAPDQMTTLNLVPDTTAPIIALSSPIVWGAQLQLEGSTLPGSTLTVEGITIPVDGQGRFKAVVPGGGDMLVMRIEHPQAGTSYAIARSGTTSTTTPTSTNQVTVSQAPGTLDRASIMKVMASLRKRFDTCAQRYPQAARATVKAKVFVEPNGRVSKAELTAGTDPKLYSCLSDVITGATFPGAGEQTVFSYPIVIEPPAKLVAPANCDPDVPRYKGMENVNMGQHAAALAQFEASLRCKQDSYVEQLAYMSACNSQNEAKAKVYWNKLTKTQQDKFEPICVRNRIDIRKLASSSSSDTDLAPAHCDADALKDKGMESINKSQHVAALKWFEQSLACKQDSYVVALAFISACNAQDAKKAGTYYAKLSAAQQTKYKVMCIRNGIDPSGSDNADDAGDVYADTSAKGYLQVFSKPSAKILVDGVDTGLTTPIKAKKLALVPGKHKITFVIGDDRFTYPVNIQAGKTERMSKDLQ